MRSCWGTLKSVTCGHKSVCLKETVTSRRPVTLENKKSSHHDTSKRSGRRGKSLDGQIYGFIKAVITHGVPLWCLAWCLYGGAPLFTLPRQTRDDENTRDSLPVTCEVGEADVSLPRPWKNRRGARGWDEGNYGVKNIGPLKTSRPFGRQMLIVFSFVSSSPTDCSAILSELQLEGWLLTGEIKLNLPCGRFLSCTLSDWELSLCVLFFLSLSPQGKGTSLWCKSELLSKPQGWQKKTTACYCIFKCGFSLSIKRLNQL